MPGKTAYLASSLLWGIFLILFSLLLSALTPYRSFYNRYRLICMISGMVIIQSRVDTTTVSTA